jgi:hypothetical protein
MPSTRPSIFPSLQPSSKPSSQPSSHPSFKPQSIPTNQPTGQPLSLPTTLTHKPSVKPTGRPSKVPTMAPLFPTLSPSLDPTFNPSIIPTVTPSPNSTDVFVPPHASNSSSLISQKMIPYIVGAIGGLCVLIVCICIARRIFLDIKSRAGSRRLKRWISDSNGENEVALADWMAKRIRGATEDIIGRSESGEKAGDSQKDGRQVSTFEQKNPLANSPKLRVVENNRILGAVAENKNEEDETKRSTLAQSEVPKRKSTITEISPEVGI